VLALLLLAAVVGFLVGYHHTSTHLRRPALAAGTVSSAGVVLEYPSGWAPASTAAPIPGLTLTHQLALAPGGNAQTQGLLSGELAEGQATPLPGALLGLLQAVPRTEVLSLPGGQAYRYSDVKLSGYSSALELFVVPGAGTAEAVLACYAPSTGAAVLGQCARIVAKLTLETQSQNDLTPDSAYAARLAAAVTALDTERLALRRQLARSLKAAPLEAVAGKLAALFARAADKLPALEPPLAAEANSAALATALGRARDSYRALKAAAQSETPVIYARVRERVDRAEAGVDRALEAFALIGYGR
jgi:hypothetical protein